MNYIRFNIGPDNPYLTNIAYNLFKEIWVPLSLELRFDLNYNDFLRNEICHLILDQDRPVAILLSSIFDLRVRATLDHDYIKSFPVKFIEEIKNENINKIMTFEYLTTLQCKDRKSHALNVLGTAFRSVVDLECEIGVCLTRDDVGVNRMVRKFGFQTFKEETLRHGKKTSFHRLYKYQCSENIEFNKKINQLWELKKDFIERKYYAKRISENSGADLNPLGL